MKRMFARSALLALVLSLAALAAPAAGTEPTLLDRGYREMYNLEFDQAHRTFAEWERLHPQDPLGPASDAAAYLFTEFDRQHILQAEFFVHDAHFYTDKKVTPDPVLKQKFDAALQRALALAGPAPQDPNAQFAAVLCDGLRSDYIGLIEKRYLAAFNQMNTARKLAEELVAEHPEFADAWLAIGVENYMLSLKPAPIRWLLRLNGGETDRTVGLEKLQLTARNGHYLAPFARLLLAVAALRDKHTDRARDLLAGLAHEFPHNPLYAQELARLEHT